MVGLLNPFNINDLKQTGAEPSWFGLGFVQLKLSPEQRMHFWHPELASNMPEEELHDHRYGFTSKVVRGELTNHLFNFRPNHEGDYMCTTVSCDPSVQAPNHPSPRGNIEPVGSFTIPEGGSYSLPKGAFHKTVATRAATLLTRPADHHEPFAHVLRLIDGQAVCPFSDPKPTAKLWEIIDDVLNGFEGEAPAYGYHMRHIERGVLGEASKVREEVEEFIDAVDQGVSLMALVELSDLTGAVDAYLQKHHPSITLADLKEMSNVTKRAFANGHRH